MNTSRNMHVNVLYLYYISSVDENGNTVYYNDNYWEWSTEEAMQFFRLSTAKSRLTTMRNIVNDMPYSRQNEKDIVEKAKITCTELEIVSEYTADKVGHRK